MIIEKKGQERDMKNEKKNICGLNWKEKNEKKLYRRWKWNKGSWFEL